MEKKDKINISVIVVVITLMVFLSTYRGGERRFVKMVSADSLTAVGEVTDVRTPYKRPITVTYFFYYNNIKYKAEVASERYASVMNELVGKKFPVIFKKSNPEKNYILIVDEDYKMFGRKPPVRPL